MARARNTPSPPAEVNTLCVEDLNKRASVSTGETLNNSRHNSASHSLVSRDENNSEPRPSHSRNTSGVSFNLRSSKLGMSLDNSKSQSSLFQDVTRGAPGDGALLAMVNRNPSQVSEQRRKSQFYSEVFAYREGIASPRERVGKDSVVSAVIKTNVIISDEFSFLTSLSQFLSQRYARPATSIMISLDHSACLVFGGSFEPAYHLTISALPSLVQSTLNKRNAALLQNFLEDVLNVPTPRGVVTFNAVAEDCLATNGVTALGEIEALKARNEASNGGGGGGSSGPGARRGKRMSVLPGVGRLESLSTHLSQQKSHDTLSPISPRSFKGAAGNAFGRSEISVTNVTLPQRQRGFDSEVTISSPSPSPQRQYPQHSKGEEKTKNRASPARASNCRKKRSIMQLFGRG